MSSAKKSRKEDKDKSKPQNGDAKPAESKLG